MSEHLDISKFINPQSSSPRIAPNAARLSGSQILKIAAEIKALKDSGRAICDLSVGDYAPRFFPLPKSLEAEMQAAFSRGETNYPPATGTAELRDAVSRSFAADFGLHYPRENILITAGSRPIVYAFFRALVARGEAVVNPTPSWNIHYYNEMAEGLEVKVRCRPENNFLPTREVLEDAVRGARALYLCSPSNPTGTMFDAEQLGAICDLVLEENKRRSLERPLFVLYDQVYWPITRGLKRHVDPVRLRPEMAAYTVFVDGISKSFAATGVRVGWALGPTDVINGMGKFISHSGAWAPKPAQLATARFLDRRDEVLASYRQLCEKVEVRLAALSHGIDALQQQGLPIRCLPPEGALYITLEAPIIGRKTPEGKLLQNNEDIRLYLLNSAGMGVVPFEAFGVEDAEGWFRLSVGAVDKTDIEALLPRLADALRALQ